MNLKQRLARVEAALPTDPPPLAILVWAQEDGTFRWGEEVISVEEYERRRAERKRERSERPRVAGPTYITHIFLHLGPLSDPE